MAITASTPPPGLPRSLDYPEVQAGSILAGAATRYGDRTAFALGDESLTFAEIYSAACRFANALRARGIGHGDVVAIHLPNCLAYPIAYHGILLAGATFSPTNPLLPPDDLAFQLTDCEAAAVVTFGPVAGTLTAVADRIPSRLTIVVAPAAEGDLGPGTVEFQAFLADQPDTRPDVTVDVHTDLAHLAYTGGTTGRSKGVQLTHRNILANSLQSACWSSGSVPVLDANGDVVIDQIGSEDEFPARLGTGVAINLTPWFHAMGVIAGLNSALLSGSTIVLHSRFDPVAYVADAERLQVTSLGGAPALFAALLATPSFHTADLSSVRGIGSGAAPMNHEMIRALQKRFPGVIIAEGYGLTEMTMGAVISPSYRSGLRKVGSVGGPVFNTELKVVGPDSEEPLPPGQEGEVCLRGPQMMRGYRNRPEENAAALVDGWLHTGDIGVIDEDGYLSIVDRKKDMLLYKGYNVFPRELEELLIALPGVRAAAVIGRPRDDVGELPVAFVVRKPSETPDADRLIAMVNEKVVPYKRLRELHFVDDIPVSAAGKVLKRELRKQLPEFS
ncbi:class I adenylate-forming enzyme family protein [Amycolatopsis saalfeldensis]|uniref:Long-chain acyl-CoA synthetase n=1 Tax=Amycolatopsis saalfeldensis TaxID=394193 RepID=A0A1H8YPY7_9PSEU|nr:AMP-binding protein [Amycolatopsis saalfeldensis]SEP54143.1 long-chain acyl-CoA synthetase [Amycolatopsis saalfeldensis]